MNKIIKSALCMVVMLSLLLSSISMFPNAASAENANVKAVSTAGRSLALKKDGTVWEWGVYRETPIGDDKTKYYKVFPEQLSGLTDVIAISDGGEHSLALRADGTVWAWGANRFGELGEGTRGITRYTPVQVKGLSNVVNIVASNNYSLALRNDGTVWAWGTQFTHLGILDGDFDKEMERRLAPIELKGLTDVAAITGGIGYEVILRKDGTVWAWGDNTYATIGDGTYNVLNYRPNPVQVKGLSHITAISANGLKTAALRDDGTVWMWGWNPSGEIGDGTKDAVKSSPVQVKGLTDITTISAGMGHSLALRKDGTVWSWGINWDGRIGDGTTEDRPAPVQVKGLSNVISISAGYTNSIALDKDGTVWMWGKNFIYGLGDGTDVDRWTPVKVIWSSNVAKPDPSSTIPPGSNPVPPGNMQKLSISQRTVPEVTQPQNSGIPEPPVEDKTNPGPTPNITPDPKLQNFIFKNQYRNGLFSDVRGTEWYADNVGNCYALGLLDGKGDAKFDPSGNILLSEAIAIAARVHHIYNGGDGVIVNTGSNWYDGAVAYAIQNHIIKQGEFTNLSKPAARAELAYIFSGALPDSSFSAVNNMFVVPDVDGTTRYSGQIYNLYKAGVLTGSDEKGNFRPNANITRAEAAAILNRVVRMDYRIQAIDPAESQLTATSGKITVNLTAGASQELSNNWLDVELSFTGSNGREMVYQLNMNNSNEFYGFMDGTYKVKAASSKYANVELKSTSVVVRGGTGTLDIVVTPRYLLDVGKGGGDYKFSFINVERLKTKVYSGTAPQTFAVTPGESYMIQDKDTGDIFTVAIQGPMR